MNAGTFERLNLCEKVRRIVVLFLSHLETSHQILEVICARKVKETSDQRQVANSNPLLLIHVASGQIRHCQKRLG